MVRFIADMTCPLLFVAEMSNYMDKVDRLKCLVLNMPPPNHDTLLFMCRHLKRWGGSAGHHVQSAHVFVFTSACFPFVWPERATFHNAEYSLGIFRDEGMNQMPPKRKYNLLLITFLFWEKIWPQEGVVSSSFSRIFCQGFKLYWNHTV